jgi:hypothetical protein
MTRSVLVIASFAALSVVHCGSEGSSGDGEVIYQGAATDEAYAVLVDAEPRVMIDAAKAANVTVPVEGQGYSPTEAAPPFRWTSALSAALERPAPARRAQAHARAELPRMTLGDLVLPGERAALAHLPPITGTVHLLRFTIPGESSLLVLTTQTSYTPDDASWRHLKGADGRVQLVITSAYLRNNIIEEGPYRAATPRSFGVDQHFW